MDKINLIIYGCGVMGRKAAQALLDKKSFKVVGAVDIDPELVGKDLGEILDKPEKLGVTIEKDAEALFSKVKAHAVVHTTTSHLKSVFSQVAQFPANLQSLQNTRNRQGVLGPDIQDPL